MCLVWAVFCGSFVIASMGPQLYRCGNPAVPPVSIEVPGLLQWGRNFIVAEMAQPHRAAAGAHQASMGPQLYRCGNGEPPRLPLNAFIGFNGAATLSLRKFLGALRSASSASSFNGAATLSLRKCQTRPDTSLRQCCFNGAATLSLRKLESKHFAVCGKCGLQWGRNFIVAEIFLLGFRHFFHVVASMGPQLYRCGNKECLYKDNEGFNYASMGPQLYRCGNHRWHHTQYTPHAASMGPQLYRCGNSEVGGDGEAPVGASMGPQLYRCGNPAHGRRDNPPKHRFNGAATLSLRKFDIPQPRTTCIRVLQWGRNFIVAEISHPVLRRLQPNDASMGPQLYRCGNRPIGHGG